MTTILMTAPTHYDVAYQINPWMRPQDWTAAPGANRLAAQRAWTALKTALEQAGARVEVMEGAAGAPDLVFPANAAVVLDGHALVARFRHPERACEEPLFLAALQRLRDRGALRSVEQIDAGVFQEGAGDCLWDARRQLFWVASGPRSSPASVAAIAHAFGRETIHLPLATERYYHLDTCFCPLSGGEILYYPPALTDAALRALHAHTSSDQRIEAGDEDAAAFSVNAVCLDRGVVMARPPQRLADRLAERGYEVVSVDLAPFILSGGGAFCMTLRLDWKSTAAPALQPRAAA